MYDDIIAYELNFAFANGIGYIMDKNLPSDAPSVGYAGKFPMIHINTNWHDKNELPFIIAHEIGHVLLENGTYYHLAFRGKQRGEATANIFAIQLLLRYCQDNDLYFDTYYNFAECFKIPRSQYYLFESIA